MIKRVLKLFLLLQLLLVFSWWLGERFIPVKVETYLGKGLGEEVSSLVSSRANFDGFHYALIAKNGYGYLQQAFFPFYPKLIAFFHDLLPRFFLPGGDSFIVPSLLISNLCFIGVIYLFGRLLGEEKIKEKTIKKSLLFFVFFPTSFYFVSLYTESLFLLLVLASFLMARKGRFLEAGILAGLASYTRLAGIFLFPALLTEYYQQASRRKMKDRLIALGQRLVNIRRNHFLQALLARIVHLKNLFYISFSLAGLGAYMIYLNRCCGDPFYFAQVQAGFGAGRTTSKLILIYQVFWRYFKMIVTVYPQQWLYFNVWLEFSISVLFLLLLLWGWYKREKYKIRASWLVFAFLAYLLPTLTGTLSSMPRYVLVCFPGFLVLSRLIEAGERKKKYHWLGKAVLSLSLILLIIVSAYFFRGYWVA